MPAADRTVFARACIAAAVRVRAFFAPSRAFPSRGASLLVRRRRSRSGCAVFTNELILAFISNKRIIGNGTKRVPHARPRIRPLTTTHASKEWIMADTDRRRRATASNRKKSPQPEKPASPFGIWPKPKARPRPPSKRDFPYTVLAQRLEEYAATLKPLPPLRPRSARRPETCTAASTYY